MSVPVIRAEGIGKRYQLGQQERYHTLRDSLSRAFTLPFRRGAAAARETSGEGRHGADGFWALRDISFDIHAGDVVGIIGRNGAGKSTLLKVLSRITEPTTGRAELRGRVGSLLEVGTGFHPELTGRENIFLNGAIIGMRRAEIMKTFDAIVEFAEVESFIDTPVKRFSSGMYLRLAFAVAAHLNPEILLVDEVLAVGDASFQKKCLGKMTEVASAGRTVIFVSHNLGVVANLCTRGLLLGGGTVIADCSAQEAINKYITLGSDDGGQTSWSEADAPCTENVRLRAVRVVSKGRVTGEVSIDEPFDVVVDFETLKPGLELSSCLHLTHPISGDILSTVNLPSASLGRDEWHGRPQPKGLFRSRCTFPANFLNEGRFGFNVVFISRAAYIEFWRHDVLHINTYDEGGMRKEWGQGWIGVVRPRMAWRTEFLGDGTAVPDVTAVSAIA